MNRLVPAAPGRFSGLLVLAGEGCYWFLTVEPLAKFV
jgi:hypothetical protein